MEWTIYDDKKECAECGAKTGLKSRRFTFTVKEESDSKVGRLEKGDLVTLHILLCEKCR